MTVYKQYALHIIIAKSLSFTNETSIISSIRRTLRHSFVKTSFISFFFETNFFHILHVHQLPYLDGKQGDELSCMSSNEMSKCYKLHLYNIKSFPSILSSFSHLSSTTFLTMEKEHMR